MLNSDQTSQNSKNSKRTFFAVPRVLPNTQAHHESSMGTEDSRQMPRFIDPNQYIKNENRDSFSEAQISNYSDPHRSIRNLKESNHNAKKLQSEIDKILEDRKSLGVKRTKDGGMDRLDSFNGQPQPLNSVASLIQVQQPPDENTVMKLNVKESFSKNSGPMLDRSIGKSSSNSPNVVDQKSIRLMDNQMEDSQILMQFRLSIKSQDALDSGDDVRNQLASKKSTKSVRFQSQWTRRVLLFMMAVRRFMMLGHNLSHNPMPVQFLTKSFYTIIGDKASSFRGITKQEPKKKRQQVLILKNNLIDPQGHFKRSWNIFVIVVYLLSLILIPLDLDFQLMNNAPLSISLVIQLIDMMINANTYIYLEGNQVQDKIVILRLNFDQYYKYDFISIIGMLMSLIDIQWFWLLRYFCLLRLKIVLNYFRDLNFHGSVLIILLTFVITNNSLACLWIQVGKTQQSLNSSSWIDAYENKTGWEHYLVSMSWAIGQTTMIQSVVIPNTNIELVTNLLTSLIGCITFAFILTHVYLVVKERYVEQQDVDTQVRKVMEYFQLKGVSSQLYGKLESYFKYHYQRKKVELIDEQSVQQILPVNMKEQLHKDLYMSLLEKSKHISQFCSTQSLDRLCEKIKSLSPVKGQIILPKDGVSDRLYFIMGGKVKMCFKRRQQEILLTTFSKGQLINENLFLTSQLSMASFVAESNTQLAYLEMNHFIEILKQHSEDFQKYFMYRENLNYNVQFQKKVKCQVCNRSSHKLNQCPFVFVAFDRRRVIKEYNKDILQERAPKYRGDNNRYNTRQHQNLISILAIGFGLNQGIFKEQDLSHEIMNRLKGNQANNDDSLFNTTQDDKTSKNTLIDRQYTYSQRNHTDYIPSGTHKTNFSGTNPQQMIRMESDRESIYTQSKRQLLNYNMDTKNQTNSSIKVQVFRTSGSEFPASPQRTSAEALRLQNQKKATTSTGQLSQYERNRRPRFSQLSAIPQVMPQGRQNTYQSLAAQLNSPQIQAPLNVSTSINQQLQKSLTSINPNSQMSPAYFDDQEYIIPLTENSSSNPMNQGFIRESFFLRNGRTIEDFDRSFSFTCYFPSQNVEWICKKINNKVREVEERYRRKREQSPTRDNLQAQHHSRVIRKSITEIHKERSIQFKYE